MELPVPVCYTDPWPADLDTAELKLSALEARMRSLFATRDRYAEHPRAHTWSLGCKEPQYTSACLLWEVLNAYHLMGVLNWNHGLKHSDHTKIHKAACFFNAIATKVLPLWNPACRQVSDGRLFVEPRFLCTGYWEIMRDICCAEIQRKGVASGLKMGTKPATLAKIAVAGWKPLCRPHMCKGTPAAAVLSKQREILRAYTLATWARSIASDNDPATYGKAVRAMESAAKTTEKLEGLEDIVSEAGTFQHTNAHVYYSAIPAEEIDGELLSTVESRMLSTIRLDALPCCVSF